MNGFRHEPRLTRRAVAFLGACALELLIAAILLRAFRADAVLPTIPLVFVGEAVLVPRTRALDLHRPAPIPLGRSLQLPALRMPASLPQPTARFPEPARAPSGAVDWMGAAERAAREGAADEALNLQRLSAAGELPQTDQPSPHGSFPWSHQPRTRWLDFDLGTLTTSVHLGRHCEFVFLVILPGFGCLLGHLDPYAGRGDLFDPTLLPPPLQLPAAPAVSRSRPPWESADEGTPANAAAP